MRKLVRNILLIINALLAVLLLIIYLSVHVSPATTWLFAFIALSYPLILLLNILFILLWLLFRKWYLVISLVCILVGWNAVRSTFQVNLKQNNPAKTEHTFSILTYNVRLFNYYQWNKDTASWHRIIDYIHTANPDIVCFQEFITLPGTYYNLANLKKMMQPLGYSHVYYTDRVPGKINFGVATFSKYPIIHKEMIDFEESLNGSIFSDILIDRDTFRIFNCHLQSIRLRKEYNDLLDSLIFNYSERQLNELKDITSRMKQAYIQRADQVELISRQVEASPHPVILCGDFNDTPVSYTYHRLSEHLRDAFIESGMGIGTTYRGNFPYVRIDYVMYSPFFKSSGYHVDKVPWSDHYPVLTTFGFSEKAN